MTPAPVTSAPDHPFNTGEGGSYRYPIAFRFLKD